MSRIKCYPAYFNKCDQQLKPISCFKLTIFFGYFLENEMLKTSWSIAGQLAEWNKTQLPKNRLYSYWTKLLPLNVHCNRQAQSWNVFCFQPWAPASAVSRISDSLTCILVLSRYSEIHWNLSIVFYSFIW